MTELKILERNQKDRRTGIEVVDIFDTRGQSSAYEWEPVALKVLRSDAEIIVAAVNEYLAKPRG